MISRNFDEARKNSLRDSNVLGVVVTPSSRGFARLPFFLSHNLPSPIHLPHLLHFELSFFQQRVERLFTVSRTVSLLSFFNPETTQACGIEGSGSLTSTLHACQRDTPNGYRTNPGFWKHYNSSRVASSIRGHRCHGFGKEIENR